MLTEKEKAMLNAPLGKRDISLTKGMDIKDAIDIITLHSDHMTQTDNNEVVLITLNEISNIIIDSYMLGYSRGRDNQN